MRNESNEKMPFVLMEKGTMLINFNEQQIEKPSMEEGEPVTMYEYESVRVPINANYGEIVTSIVREKYSQSEIEAIVINGGDTEEHTEEMAALQEWRKKAKEIAKKVVEA